MTKKLDLELRYDATFGLAESVSDTHRFMAMLSLNAWKNLDVDISLTWDRVTNPQSGRDQSEPKSDDFRMQVGVGVLNMCCRQEARRQACLAAGENTKAGVRSPETRGRPDDEAA